MIFFDFTLVFRGRRTYCGSGGCRLLYVGLSSSSPLFPITRLWTRQLTDSASARPGISATVVTSRCSRARRHPLSSNPSRGLRNRRGNVFSLQILLPRSGAFGTPQHPVERPSDVAFLGRELAVANGVRGEVGSDPLKSSPTPPATGFAPSSPPQELDSVEENNSWRNVAGLLSHKPYMYPSAVAPGHLMTSP